MTMTDDHSGGVAYEVRGLGEDLLCGRHWQHLGSLQGTTSPPPVAANEWRGGFTVRLLCVVNVCV